MSAKDLIEGAVEHLQTSASVKTVYGTPITAEGRTVIPVAKVAYGFGAGSGRGVQDKKKGENGKGPVDGEGEGAGGGIAAKPVGVVEITADETKFVQFGAPRKLALTALIGSALGVAIGWLLGRKTGRS
ncbi:MAG TPA: spore germination protein GerW family protein [Gemmatimonadales bacterium]|nr:spore germination protein GerW family protein [Gemmatimonadales bacterium]